MHSLKNISSKRDTEGGLSAMRVRSDEALLHLIQKKNQQAYEELFSRYIKRAYALAKNLTRSNELAEEAAQEALLAIWRSAASFDQDRGTAQPWIFRIIANKAVQIVRKEHQDRCREKDNSLAPDNNLANGELLTELGQQDLKSRLRELIAGLSHENRYLVALYYGAGFSQDKISEIVSIPQRKVSKKLKKVLEQLRLGLSKGGHVVPSALGPIILENMWTGSSLPKASAENILERILSNVQSGSSQTNVTGTMPGNVMLAVGVLSIAALSAAALQYFTPESNGIVNPEPDLTLTEESNSALPAKRIQRWKKTWNFDLPDSTKDLTFGIKKPIHKSSGGVKGSGYLSFQSVSDHPTITLADRHLPLKFSCQMKPAVLNKNRMFSTTLKWSKSQCPIVHAMFETISTLKRPRKGEWTTFTFYIQTQAVDSWVQVSSLTKPKRTSVMLMQFLDNVSFSLASSSLNFDLDNLTVEEVTLNEIPDVSDFIAAYERREAELKAGESVPIPELTRHQNLSKPIEMTKLSDSITSKRFWFQK